VYEGVELAKTVTELRSERQRLDDERRSVADELTSTQQRLSELSDTQQRITVLESQLANTTSQVGVALIGKRVVDCLLVLIELFSLDVTAEAQRANIGSKSAISLQRGRLAQNLE